MSDSLLKFTREFEKLKTRLQAIPALDLKLLTLVEFQPHLEKFKDKPAFRTYFDEYFSLLMHFVKNDSLDDLTIDELLSVFNVIILFKDGTENKTDDIFKKTALALAKKLFYVGEIERALSVFEKLLNEKIEITIEESKGYVEFDTFHELTFQARERHPKLYNILLDILIEWESIRKSTRSAGVFCLFVEKDDFGKHYRGRMKLLQGQVELNTHKDETDEVTFHNQIKAPDDPFVGVAYDALGAVRHLFANLRQHDKTKNGYHAHYSIIGSSHTYTGDSIGLAFALTAYTQLIKPDITRYDQYISSEAAVTGSIAPDGQLVAVKQDSLSCKIERAFFSPVKYVVLPEASLQETQECLGKLNERYPRRRLYLIGHEYLREVIENHNVIRDEKVCAGTLFKRKISRYSRLATIQVPLLLALLYVFVCLIYPKASPWFDYHIDHIEIMGNRFKTVNPDGYTIWTSEEFDEPLIAKHYKPDFHKTTLIIDIDDDNRDELVFCTSLKSNNNSILFYEDDGSLIWESETYIITDYPGDKGYDNIIINHHYSFANIILYKDTIGDIYIISSSFASQPSRTQVMTLDINGNLVSGPMILTGAFGFKIDNLNFTTTKEQVIVMAGTNNRYEGCGLLILNPMDLCGVSPPYNNKLFKISEMTKGSQLYYIHFPESPLSHEKEIRNFVTSVEYNKYIKSFEVEIQEGSGIIVDNKKYTSRDTLPNLFYDLDSNMIPIQVYAGDAVFDYLNLLLEKTGKTPIKNPSKLLDSLKCEVIVYYGDSIVHHLASGIDFYEKK